VRLGSVVFALDAGADAVLTGAVGAAGEQAPMRAISVAITATRREAAGRRSTVTLAW
jgi:hypothetical protein